MINRSVAGVGSLVVLGVVVAILASTPTAAQTVCSVGMRIGPGERCTYPGSDQDFWVDSSGTGRFMFFTSGGSISADGTTINGVTYYFRATKQFDGDWLIEMAGTGTPTTTTTTRPTTTTTRRTTTTTTRPTTTTTYPSDTAGRFTSVSAGDDHSCAISTQSTITCWGYDLFGQVSDTPSGSFTSISAGSYHSCAITTQGEVRCWGTDSYGQVSNAPSDSFTSVSAGTYHSCAVSTQGAITCWGHLASPYVLWKQVIMDTPSGSFTSVSAGDEHSCAVTADGAVLCWGDDDYGKVSDAPSGSFTSVSAGDEHSCAVTADGAVLCWGDDDYGKVSDAPSGSFTSVSAGDEHSCAVTADGAVLCWGDDDYGKVSDAPSGSFTSVSAGDEHSCAVRADGAVLCWGDDDYGKVSGAPSAPSSTTRPVVSGVGGPSADELCDPLDGVQFSDVGEGSYGAGYILCARVLGLSRGSGPGRFSPDAKLTRGQAASFLVRLWRDILGGACPDGGHPFSDVDGVHEADIACLFALGITKGTTRSTFGPYHALTVSQVSRFVVRMLNLVMPSTCITSGNELEAAAGCLVRFNIAPDTAEAKSKDVVSRAQMAVYLIGLWHNVAGQGMPPAPPLRPAEEPTPTTTTTRPRPTTTTTAPRVTTTTMRRTTTTTTQPPDTGDILTWNDRSCTAKHSAGDFYKVTISGTLRAKIGVSSLTVTGYANGDHISSTFVGSISAGQSKSFVIFGSILTTSDTIRCQIEWRGTVHR